MLAAVVAAGALLLAQASPAHTLTLDQAIERAVGRVGAPERLTVVGDFNGPSRGDLRRLAAVLAGDTLSTCAFLATSPDLEEGGLWAHPFGRRPSCGQVVASRAVVGGAVYGLGELLAHKGHGKAGRVTVRIATALLGGMVVNNLIRLGH